MKRKQFCFLMVTVSLAVMMCTLNQTSALSAPSHSIYLTPGDDYLYVTERITISGIDLNDSVFVSLWIPSEANELKASMNNTILSLSLLENNIYQANLSVVNDALISSEQIEVTYTLPMSKNEFLKTFIRNTSELTIKYDDELLASASDITEDTMMNLAFPSSTDKALFNVYTLTLTILLIILLLVSFVYGIRKKKNGKARVRSFESKEVLSTEKSLLMDLLKQIEKMHRSEKMSDDTYHKLKEYYKQQTVEIMSEIENMQSKIKE